MTVKISVMGVVNAMKKSDAVLPSVLLKIIVISVSASRVGVILRGPQVRVKRGVVPPWIRKITRHPTNENAKGGNRSKK